MTISKSGLIWGLVLLLMVLPAAADWDPADGHKMHFPQFPNEYGWNVYNSDGRILADDWMCSESGPVTDIHFWGSWYSGNQGTLNGFWITIYEDIPADLGDPLSYSQPGAVLWGPVYFTEYAVRHITPDPEAWEGWYDPIQMLVLPYDHDNFFQYNITGITDPFVQSQGTIYWLGIVADVESEVDSKLWGWKSSYLHWNDDAVYDNAGWAELTEPDVGFQFNGFHVEIDGAGGLITGSGERAWNNTWYYYTDVDPGWWNIWFYDHPLAMDRWKEVSVVGNIRTQVMGMPGYATIAVNWTTPAWSEVGNPPGDPRRPPLPGDVAPPVLPGTYLMRQILWQGPVVDIPTDLGQLGYSIEGYNPEWVSIDVQGENFVLDGSISHACVGVEPQSMDLGRGRPDGRLLPS